MTQLYQERCDTVNRIDRVTNDMRLEIMKREY
jgi:hypothetical protein